MHLLVVWRSCCWTDWNAPTGSLSVFLLNRQKFTYWQSFSLLVEQTKMRLLAVWQSCCWTDWNAPTGSLAVFLFSRLKCTHWQFVFLFNRQKCTYWQSFSLLVEQTEIHQLAVCQSCWTDWNAPTGSLSSCWTDWNAPTLSLSVILNRLRCTYWQSLSPVERTEMHVLAVCQSCWADWNAPSGSLSSCWTDWNAPTGSLSIPLNRLKCAYCRSCAPLYEISWQGPTTRTILQVIHVKRTHILYNSA